MSAGIIDHLFERTCRGLKHTHNFNVSCITLALQIKLEAAFRLEQAYRMIHENLFARLPWNVVAAHHTERINISDTQLRAPPSALVHCCPDSTPPCHAFLMIHCAAGQKPKRSTHVCGLSMKAPYELGTVAIVPSWGWSMIRQVFLSDACDAYRRPRFKAGPTAPLLRIARTSQKRAGPRTATAPIKLLHT